MDRAHHSSLRVVLAVACAVAASGAAVAAPPERVVVHVIAGGVRTALAVLGDEIVMAQAFDVKSGAAAPLPRELLADPDREVWVIDTGKKTRIRYARGLETGRDTWDRESGTRLDPEFHLVLPPALERGIPSRLRSAEPPPAPAPPQGPRVAPEPARGAEPGGAYVGEARPATDLFGETLDGLVPAKQDLPTPVRFGGYVDVLLSAQDDDASAHALELGPGNNTSLEAREGVLNMDAGLGDRVRWFGQARFVRFNAPDLRVNMLEIGDPSKAHGRIGRQITPVGLFPAKNVSDRNPLVGFPLPYGYRTALRPDQAAAGPAALLATRGTGAGGNGVGLAGPALYQTYLLYQTPLGRKANLLAGVQNGAQSNMENRTINDALGVIGRLSFTPHPAVKLGLTGSNAAWMAGNATGLAAGEQGEDFEQSLLAFDLELARGPLVFDLEILSSEWDVSRSLGVSSLEALGFNAELKWTVAPKVYVATRYSGLRFDDIPDGAGGRASWDFDVDRFEIGLGYRPFANLVTKLVGQFNETDGPTDPDDDLYALQVVGKF